MEAFSFDGLATCTIPTWRWRGVCFLMFAFFGVFLFKCFATLFFFLLKLRSCQTLRLVSMYVECCVFDVDVFDVPGSWCLGACHATGLCCHVVSPSSINHYLLVIVSHMMSDERPQSTAAVLTTDNSKLSLYHSRPSDMAHLRRWRS